MAHCNQHLSGATNVAAPTSPATGVVVEKSGSGSSAGLGCSSNYTVVACTYNSNTASLVVYDSNGDRIFDSGMILDAAASSSAALVSTAGEVIAADDKTLVRFAANGTVVWQTALRGSGLPISPVLTENGVLVVATYGGIISSYSAATGAVLGTLSVRFDGLTYQTQNTPTVNGNRVYVSMASDNAPTFGRLVAIDVSAGATSPLSIAWSYVFGGPSGASPVFQSGVIYFDGSSLYPGPGGYATLFAVQDEGASPLLLWANQLVTSRNAPSPAIKTSPLPDPRGGIWFYIASQSTLQRVDPNTGNSLQVIDMDSFFSNRLTHLPSTALTMASTNPSTGNPVMLLGLGTVAGMVTGPSFAVAVDLGTTTPTLLWSVQFAPITASNYIFCQFPIVAAPDGSPRVVFPGSSANTYFVGSSQTNRF
jgi:PQQ-like domain